MYILPLYMYKMWMTWLSKVWLFILQVMMGVMVSLSPVICQSSDYIYKQYKIADGLPSNECYDVIQDFSGYIWISTDNGVSRYDGYEFVTYDIGDGLEDLVIFNLYLDEVGVIWAGGLMEQLFYYDSAADYWYPYEHQRVLDSLKRFNTVRSSFYFNRDTLHTIKNGLGFLEVTKDGVSNVDNPGEKGGVFLHRQRSGSLVYSYQPEDNVSGVLPIFTKTHTQDSTWEVAGQVQIPKGGFSLTRSFNTKHHIYLYGNHITSIFSDRGEYEKERLVPNIQSMVQTSAGNIVACHNAPVGVRIYNDEWLMRYESILEDVDASNFVEDSEGGYWITTLDKGLFYIANLHSKYLSPHHQDGFYSLLTQDHRGHIYAASYEGVLDRTDINSNYVNLIDYQVGDQYEAIFFDTIAQVLLYSNAGRTVAYDSLGAKHEVLKNDEDIKKSISTKAFSFIKSDLVALTISGRLLRFDNSNRTHTTQLDHKLLSILPREDQAIVGTSGGLYHYADDDSEFLGSLDSLFTLRVDAIADDGKGKLYLGTKGSGIIIWEQGFDPYLITTEDGLLSNNVEDLCLGSGGYMWVATSQGINRLKIDQAGTLDIRKYTVSHGLPVDDVYDLEWYNDRLYAATSKGVIVLEDRNPDENARAPKIRGILSNNVSQTLGDDISLPHDQNNILVRFSVIDYDHGKHVRYRLSINGDEPRILEERQIYLTDLRSGTYKLSIESENKDGYWSAPARATIKIRKAWYQTWWFAGVVLILASGAVVSHFLRREDRLREENATQEEIRSLERAALSSQMNPHFIFNSLNSIQNYIMSNDKLMAMDYLSRFAKLIRLTLRASTQQSVSLQDEIRILEYYLGLEKMRFKDKFKWSITISKDLNGSAVGLPPMLVQPLVENAIKHGMRDKQDDGMVDIYFDKLADHLQVRVRDNGPGFSQDVMAGFAEDAHQSLGMRITSDRVGKDGKLTVKRVEGWTEVEVLIKPQAVIDCQR